MGYGVTGNTEDSDSFVLGSNPGTPAIFPEFSSDFPWLFCVSGTHSSGCSRSAREWRSEIQAIDIIRIAAITSTLKGAAELVAIVLIRAVLSFSIELEITGGGCGSKHQWRRALTLRGRE